MKPYNGGKPTFEEFLSPIGLVVHLFHDQPQMKTKDQHGKVPDIDPETGFQLGEYKATLAWEKSRAQSDLAPLIQLAQKVKADAWPESTKPGAFFALQPFFRDGDNPEHNTKARDYLFGKYYLNFKQKAKAVKDPATGRPIYSGGPGIVGPYNEDILPLDIYPGCTARVSGIMFGTEYMSKHYISTRLNNIQLFEKGERIGGGGRPDPKTQFEALKTGDMSGLSGLGL